MDYSTTGDGLLAGLQLLRIMRERGTPLSELSHLIEPFPQVLRNVHVRRRVPFEEVPEIRRAVEAVERELGDRGRVLLRYSGTESVARVMVEGQDEARVAQLAADLAQVLERGLR
jgi:phosphoglucosamine mutase